jgi:hypothetical protein
MHEWKKAIEAASISTSTENDNNSLSSTLHESNVEITSEYIEPEKSKELKNNSNEVEIDLIMAKDEKIDHIEGLVPLPTPIIPAKRVASCPSPTLNNQNGKNLYNENGSDIKGKRQKTEELQNLPKGKTKEIEIEKEGTKLSQKNNMQYITSDNRDNFESITSMKASEDQATDSLTTFNSANEVSKPTTSKPKKLSLNEYRAITASQNKEASEKKSITEGSKSPISSVAENDKKDNPIDNNDISSTKESGTSTVNTQTKTKLSYKEFKDIRLAESSNNNNVDVLKKSTDQVSEQRSGITENKQINEQAKSEDITVVSISPKPPITSTTEDNNIASRSSLINDGYFPEVDLPPGFSITPSKDIDAFNTNEYSRHANSSHSDGSYEETRGRHSPSYKDYSSTKSSGNYNSSYNIPLCDTSMQTSPRPEHMSPPRGPRYYGGHFRGNRIGGPYRGMSMSPGDRGRYHSGSGYFNSAGSLPATPRQGAQSSIMSSSASSPYDPANPDGQSSNISNERDPSLDNVGNNSGTMESKARDYARTGGDRSERWGYNNYFMDRSREREWRERERDDGRKDWNNNKRLDHHYSREREGYPMMATRRPSSGPHQDRYTMIGGSGI